MRVIYCMLIMFISIDGISQYKKTQDNTKNKVDLLNKGNEYFQEGNFKESEYYYKQSLEADNQYYKANLNTGHSLFRQAMYFMQKEMLDSARIKCSEAESFYRNSIELTENKDEKAESLYNLGNCQLLSNKLKESIESYKKSLRMIPEDTITKHNLAFAQYLLNQEQKENKEQEENQDQKENKEQEENQDQKENKEQEGNQDKKENQELNEEQIQQILNALDKKDQEVQNKLQKRKKNTKNKSLKDW